MNVIVGFGFQAALAATLGVDVLADVFQVAWTIVTFMAVVQFTMVLSLLVPRLQIRGTGSDSIGGSVLPLILGIAVAALQALGASVFASGDLRTLLLAAAPAHVFVGGAAVPQALAYITKRFWVAGAGPIANGLALLLATLLGLRTISAAMLGFSLTLGYLAQWLVTSLGTRDINQTVPTRGTIPVGLFLGVLGFTLLSKFQPVLERIISYRLATGTTAGLGYGQKVAQGLVMFATFGFATAATATLAQHVEAKNSSEAAELLARITLATVVFGSVVTAVALPAAYPAVVILFERGVFTQRDSGFVANVVVAQLPWVWAGALAGVASSYLFAARKYAQLAVAALASLAVTLLSGTMLSGPLPQYAVAIASSAGMVTSLLVATVILKQTEIWEHYWPLIVERRRLWVSAIAVLVSSWSIFGILQFLVAAPSLVEYLLAALATLVSAMAILVSSSKTRAELADLRNASL